MNYLLGVIGVILFFAFAPSFLKSLGTRQWRPIHALIIETSMETRTLQDGTRDYAPRLRYRYEVDGKTFYSTALRVVGTSYRDSSYAKTIIQRYPVGKLTNGFVHPKRPQDAVLEPGTEWLAAFASLLGLGFFIASFFLS